MAGYRHPESLWMLQVAVATFATAIDKTSTLKIGDQLANFARHYLQYRGDTTKVKQYLPGKTGQPNSNQASVSL
jgi:hypothetical protein